MNDGFRSTTADSRQRRAGLAAKHPILRALVAALLSVACTGGASSNPAASQVAAADMPTEHAEGKRLYEAHCARCHGINAAGTGRGPSFLSKVYESGHHGDQAFFLAVKRGVTAHHWAFGNMPPVTGVSEDEVAKIVGYIRWAQGVAGIS